MGRYSNYDDFDDDLDLLRRPVRRDRPHSGIGIASLILAAVAAAVTAVAVALAICSQAMQPGPDEEELLVGIAGLLVFGGGACTVAGLIVGLIGSFQSDRNPVCAILGAVANALTLFGMIFLVCFGIFAAGL
jgi:hypothetical protein